MGGTTSTNCRNMNSAASRFIPPPRMHYKCREPVYPRDNIERLPVPEDKVPWSVPWPEYKPVSHTTNSVKNKPVWADLDYEVEDSSSVQWNALCGKVDRRSHNGFYEIVNNLPRNPVGRTGLRSRGTLGRWGPNHAADPIVTRWKRDEVGNPIQSKESGKKMLEFISVQRRDTGEWAIPGGMVDPGENISVTLKREFSEEALNALEASDEEKHRIETSIADLFTKGSTVYKGYVDDPRNTDNAWMETTAVNFHDETGDSVGRVKLHAGDDAVGVRWTDIHKNLRLFASHSHFIKTVAEMHDAHW